MKEKFIPGKTRIRYGGAYFGREEIDAAIASLRSGRLALGERAAEFEDKLAKALGVKEAIVVNSGSSANLLAITALELPRGAEVIVPACIFSTTLNPILQCGLVPVVVDVRIGSYNIDPDLIRQAISNKTKAIMISHTMGNPCDMDKIMHITREHKLKVIEDNCEALGARYKGRPTGTFGAAGTSSFYVPHQITMGEGGAVYTNDSKLAERVRSLRDWGRACVCKECIMAKNPNGRCAKRFRGSYDARFVYEHIGYNLRPLELQCAIGLKQLEKLQRIVMLRQANFCRLYHIFASYQSEFILPDFYPQPDFSISPFAFPLTARRKGLRDEIVRYLEGRNIETRMLLAGNITRHPAYRHAAYRISDRLPNADYIMENSFYLGVWPGITQEMMAYIEASIKEFFKEGKKK
jgi:CDP-6-deoxy-D-xylo-4-hexulose-3-dehydrase